MAEGRSARLNLWKCLIVMGFPLRAGKSGGCSMQAVRINDQGIGEGQPCYFLAEIGGNYGSVADVHTIVDVCVAIGMNAIKFQTFEAATVTTPDNMFDLEITGKVPQVELFQEYEPPKELQRELMRYAGEKGITAFSAPSHLQDLDFLEQLNMPAYKIGSDLACHIPLLREVAQTRKPILLSTGMATLEEIHASVEEVLKVHDQLILLHCVSDYPTHAENVNLKTTKRTQSNGMSVSVITQELSSVIVITMKSAAVYSPTVDSAR